MTQAVLTIIAESRLAAIEALEEMITHIQDTEYEGEISEYLVLKEIVEQ